MKQRYEQCRAYTSHSKLEAERKRKRLRRKDVSVKSILQLNPTDQNAHRLCHVERSNHRRDTPQHECHHTCSDDHHDCSASNLTHRLRKNITISYTCHRLYTKVQCYLVDLIDWHIFHCSGTFSEWAQRQIDTEQQSYKQSQAKTATEKKRATGWVIFHLQCQSRQWSSWVPHRCFQLRQRDGTYMLTSVLW